MAIFRLCFYHLRSHFRANSRSSCSGNSSNNLGSATPTVATVGTILLGLETELRGGASKEESEEVKFCKPGGVMYVTGKRGEKCREIYDVDWQKVGSFCKQALTYGSLANPEVSLFLPLCTELQGNTSRSALSDDDWIRLVAQVEEILSR